MTVAAKNVKNLITGTAMLSLVIFTGCEPTTTTATSIPPAAPQKAPDALIEVRGMKERGAPVEVRSMNELGQYYDAIGFNLSTNPDALHAVPRLRFTHVPKTWEGEPSILLKQSVFFRTMITMALEVNEEIMAQRQKLLKIDMEKPLSIDDRKWLQKMMARYKVSKKSGPYSPAKLAELHLRIDIIPPSLTLVQAAIESAWGSSRFAREANALFGQWTKRGRGIKAKKSDVWLAAFSNPHESVAAYCLNLNTHPSYSVFRVARAKMRREGCPLNGIELAMYLQKYSAKGVEYTSLVQNMITRHGLEIADTARLADALEIVIKPIDRPAPDGSAT
jgi:Bax protein